MLTTLQRCKCHSLWQKFDTQISATANDYVKIIVNKLYETNEIFATKLGCGFMNGFLMRQTY